MNADFIRNINSRKHWEIIKVRREINSQNVISCEANISVDTDDGKHFSH